MRRDFIVDRPWFYITKLTSKIRFSGLNLRKSDSFYQQTDVIGGFSKDRYLIIQVPFRNEYPDFVDEDHLV